tara:strand:+ start:299 stop:1786 length:1488 start_codon:yes stop_codon:yes gene_type:complete
MFLEKVFNKNLRTRGRKIELDLKPASLDIVKLDKVEKLVYALEDAKFNYYTPTVKVGDKVKKGQVVAVCNEVHGLRKLISYDGTVEAIKKVKAPIPQKTCDALIIKPDHPEYVFEDVLYNMDVKLSEYPKEMIFQKIVQANIKGLGGGLFLSGKKLINNGIKHVVLNGAECEPILNCDEALMNSYLAEILAGGIFLKTAASAETLTIVVKETKKELIEHIKFFINNNEEFNEIKVKTVPDTYPAGAEKEILRYAFNTLLTASQLLTDNGFLMQNIMTAVTIFRAVTCDLAQLERVVSVFGKGVENPTNVLIPKGTTLNDVLRFLKIEKPSSVRLGGFMMGEDIIDDDSIEHTVLLKSSNGIILNLKEDKQVTDCINCGECVKVCPVDLVPNKMFEAGEAEDFENKYLKNLSECMLCGLCNHVCPSNIDLVGMFKYARQEKINIEQEHKRAEYISHLTNKKLARTEAERLEKERIKLERKKAREARLAKKKEQENA